MDSDKCDKTPFKYMLYVIGCNGFVGGLREPWRRRGSENHCHIWQCYVYGDYHEHKMVCVYFVIYLDSCVTQHGVFI